MSTFTSSGLVKWLLHDPEGMVLGGRTVPHSEEALTPSVTHKEQLAASPAHTLDPTLGSSVKVSWLCQPTGHIKGERMTLKRLHRPVLVNCQCFST